MDQKRASRVEEAFHAALELEGDEREEFLHRCAGSDRELAAEVRELITSHSKTDLLDHSPGELIGAKAYDELVEGAQVQPRWIGPYEIMSTLGHGGFGVVYLAHQVEPFERDVALKVLRPGMDSEQVLARFEAERQALAMLDHPGIAKAFDAGATAEGRPYFAMELAAGIPITRFCDEQRYGTEERLDVFRRVCLAVQHAHQKGIVHRDLKPTNILTELRDGESRPTIIDFGLAKAVDRSLGGEPLVTQAGAFVGTLEYASPEQVHTDDHGVDTRTDIYALGVLLYELLTGELPFDPERLHGLRLADVQRVICEEDPPVPSRRVSRGTGSTPPSGSRGATPSSLRRRLEGDIDWIVMKAMEKDRRRRYSSASDLAAEIERHLNHEPVLAGPPDLSYRLSKFMRRNRGLVLASAAVLVTLVLGLASSITGWRRATLQRNRAVKAENQLVLELEATEVARAAAEREAEIASATQVFLQEMLSAPDPYSDASLAPVAREVKVAEVLERASDQVDSRFPGSPEVRAALRETLGATFLGLGRLDAAETELSEAIRLRESSSGAEHHDALGARRLLTELLIEKDEHESAADNILRCIEISNRHHGEEAPTTISLRVDLAILRTQMGFADEAESILRDVLEVLVVTPGETHELTLRARSSLGITLNYQGRLSEAEAIHAETLELAEAAYGPGHELARNALMNLALMHYQRRDFAMAESLLRRALEQARASNSVDAHFYVKSLADALTLQGKHAEAESLFREALDDARESLGSEHPVVLPYFGDLADALLEGGELSAAEDVLREGLDIALRTLGPNHGHSIELYYALARVLTARGSYGEAEELYRNAIRAAQILFSELHPETLSAKVRLAEFLAGSGRLVEAEELARAVLDARLAKQDPEDSDTLAAMSRLGSYLQRQGKFGEAEPLLVAAADGWPELDGDNGLRALSALRDLGLLRQDQGRVPEAEALFLGVFDACLSTFGPADPITRELARPFVAILRQQRRDAEADEVLEMIR